MIGISLVIGVSLVICGGSPGVAAAALEWRRSPGVAAAALELPQSRSGGSPGVAGQVEFL